MIKHFQKVGKSIYNRAKGVKEALISRPPLMRWYGDYITDNYTWFNDKELLDLQEEFSGHRPLYAKDRYFNIYNISKLAKNIPGDTIECGVFEGFGSFLIMKSTEIEGRVHHIFDSFEGLSEPDPVDINTSAPLVWKKHDLAVDFQSVSRRFEPYPNVKLYKGWIPDVFAENKITAISFLHIDVDLYQPTLDSLKEFYDRMSKGGVILFDDYSSSSCPGEMKAVEEFFCDKPEPVVAISTCQAFVIKQ